jgi:hypothetical protein
MIFLIKSGATTPGMVFSVTSLIGVTLGYDFVLGISIKVKLVV